MCLAGPLQSWGSTSRFSRRTTDHAPTKSGVIGLLAAALGMQRTEPMGDLPALQFGVRIDQPGRIERDFQTARSADGRKSFPLTDRFYLADAAFVAAVQGEAALIDHLDNALRHPQFPLYLGRRSCPPSRPVAIGVQNRDLWTALTDIEGTPWQASVPWRIRQPAVIDVEIQVDAAAVPGDLAPGQQPALVSTEHDAPVSFDSELREYAWRPVAHSSIAITNVHSRQELPRRHDPMPLLGES